MHRTPLALVMGAFIALGTGCLDDTDPDSGSVVGAWTATTTDGRVIATLELTPKGSYSYRESTEFGGNTFLARYLASDDVLTVKPADPERETFVTTYAVRDGRLSLAAAHQVAASDSETRVFESINHGISEGTPWQTASVYTLHRGGGLEVLVASDSDETRRTGHWRAGPGCAIELLYDDQQPEVGSVAIAVELRDGALGSFSYRRADGPLASP